MTEQTILIDRDDHVATLTLNRPDRLNSFTADMHAELKRAIRQVHDARVLILTGAGRGFCAGQDLNDRKVAPGEAVDLGETVEESWNPLIRTIATLPQPVLCAVNGVAAGAGANIALACDLTFAARSARFIQSFSALGLIPDSGGSWHLPRLVGQQRALGLALTGEPLDAEQAADWGMIWKVVDDELLMEEVRATAHRLASLPPLGLAAIKKLIRTSGSRDLEKELDLQRDEMRRLGYTEDYREGVAAFLEKRKPTFKGK
ncbi:2-(1,2-epoxy-1,2-dihydrophenyl)acetyl-CoA isomerase PaaG [Sphingomicrobium aestuariivivum]|uniref:2-(1,2-epoxy-1,2-dihydrophenyl)acetyl-CoA isomerase PaaG n=1 Tax=Sphingomicrobium aestuariivivum TaxID=1582356 RepID=UPI001FD65144|nr:2-(1,2-epoxy-1,2-dihydrophenyl)acetyl-CoA isomerase PaaG [Sphingomicrobium aestuariivivum]MCJ8190314.1 2-(1,2-epoxy-1,2-dihydrophenyl)acetyl-CoA isomerase PaaG [Sphingomicrobium aestuariivivum]